MGIFSFNNFEPDTSDDVLIAQAKLARKREAGVKSPAEQLAELKKQQAIERFASSGLAKTGSNISQAKSKVGFSVGRAAGVGLRQQVDFSPEQRMLQQMFGHGDKIWGINNEPVQINNDLNPSQSDPFDETSSMFGFGVQSEKSGLW